MLANEFEKEVRRVMDDFKLRPSGDVWENVERRIREKKKRRRILFFMFFSFIGLLLGGYGIYHFTSEPTMGKNEQQVSAQKTNNATVSRHKQGTTSTEKPTSVNSFEKRQNYKTNQTHAISALTRRNLLASKMRIGTRNPASGINEAPINDGLSKNNENNIPDLQNENPAEQKISHQPLTHELPNINGAHSLKEKAALMKNLDDSPTKSVESNSNEQTHTKGKNKPGGQLFRNIQWGINFSIGASVITEDPLSFKSSGRQADVSPLSTGNAPGGLMRYPPSANKPVVSFKAGVVLKKNLSARSAISAGLQYAYVGDRIKASSLQSTYSSASSYTYYYRATPQTAYTDRLHFIELPLGYSWKMNTSKRQFLTLDAAVAPGYLLAKSVLVYDTSNGGIYYRNKSSLSKTCISVGSGVSYHLASGKYEWTIGPQFSFDLSKIIKSDLDQRKYLLFGGIDIRIFFGNKKK